MRADIHPDYKPRKVHCACGNEFEVGMVYDEDVLKVDICSACHPFFTGEGLKLVDTEGRVERFRRKYANFDLKSKKKKKQEAAAE